MKCPVCKDTTLKSTRLESELKAATCASCGGKWISASDYWNWLDRHGETLLEKEPEEAPIEVSDNQKAKICPWCRHIMLRYKVGRGLNFTLDQCGNCNSIWFDRNEWEALKQRNLHDEVHLVFSAPWQDRIRKEETHQLLDSLYKKRFKEDYDRVRQIKDWIDNHPEKDEILAYLSSSDPYSISNA